LRTQFVPGTAFASPRCLSTAPENGCPLFCYCLLQFMELDFSLSGPVAARHYDSLQRYRMNKERIVELRYLLEQRRRELISSDNRTRVESRHDRDGEGTLDYVDYATHSYEKEFLLSLSSIERAELHRIEQAIADIDAGNYGECQECGEPISDKRLRAVPWARHCIRCQELEEQGLLPSYQFKAKDTIPCEEED